MKLYSCAEMPLGDNFCFRVTLQGFIDDEAYEVYQNKAQSTHASQKSLKMLQKGTL